MSKCGRSRPYIPAMHRRGALSSALQLILILAGIATIAILHTAE